MSARRRWMPSSPRAYHRPAMALDPIVGATVRRRARFFDLDGTPLVPTEVTVRLEHAAGVLDLTLEDLTVDGDFLTYRFTTTNAGRHGERWTATQGETIVVAQASFYVRESNVSVDAG